MKMKIHGPVGIVTGSCYELRDEETNNHFLVDCGIQQGESTMDSWNEGPFPFDPKSLDFVILTHAHLDHCGLLPRLYQEGFNGLVCCTKATAELAVLNLKSSAKLNNAFRKQDVDAIRWKTNWGQVLNREHKFRGLRLTFRRTAHMLGAVSVRVSWGASDEHNEITFSGDIGSNSSQNEFQPLLRHRVGPFKPRGAKSYAVLESTYGAVCRTNIHLDFDRRIETLRQYVTHTTIKKGGMLIVPCFAIGRTQDVLFDLHYLYAQHPELSDIPIYFDAGLAYEVNRVYARALRRRDKRARGGDVPMWLSAQLLQRFGLDRTPSDESLLSELVANLFTPGCAATSPTEHGNAILQRFEPRWSRGLRDHGKVVMPDSPCIVVTGGGMCDGGVVVEYLKQRLNAESTTVLFTGYCGASTNGGRLLALKDLARKERAKSSEMISWGDAEMKVQDIHAEIEQMPGYSGHADQAGLLDWFFGCHRKRPYAGANMVFLTHGNDRNRTELADSLRCRAKRLGLAPLRVEMPNAHSGWFDLNIGVWKADPEEVLDTLSPMFAGMTAEQKTVVIKGLMDLLSAA